MVWPRRWSPPNLRSRSGQLASAAHSQLLSSPVSLQPVPVIPPLPARPRQSRQSKIPKASRGWRVGAWPHGHAKEVGRPPLAKCRRHSRSLLPQGLVPLPVVSDPPAVAKETTLCGTATWAQFTCDRPHHALESLELLESIEPVQPLRAGAKRDCSICSQLKNAG